MQWVILPSVRTPLRCLHKLHYEGLSEHVSVPVDLGSGIGMGSGIRQMSHIKGGSVRSQCARFPFLFLRHLSISTSKRGDAPAALDADWVNSCSRLFCYFVVHIEVQDAWCLLHRSHFASTPDLALLLLHHPIPFDLCRNIMKAAIFATLVASSHSFVSHSGVRSSSRRLALYALMITALECCNQCA